MGSPKQANFKSHVLKTQMQATFLCETIAMKPSTKMWLPTPTMQVGQPGGGKATRASGGRDVLDVAASEVPRFGCYAASEGEGRRAGPPGLGCAATIRRRMCRIRARLFARRPAIPAASMDWRSLSGDVVVQLFWQGMYDELQEREHRIILGQHKLCDIIGLVDRGGQSEGSNPWAPEKPTCVGHPCGGSQVQGAQVPGSPFFIGVTNDGGLQQQEREITKQDREETDFSRKH